MSEASTSGRGFGYWLNIFANLAVVGGIIFLGVEVRQNSRMMKAQIRNEITQNIFDVIDRALHPDVIEARLRLRNGEAPLPRDEYVLDLTARATFRSFENTEYQNRMGLFDQTEYQANVSFIELYLQSPSNFEWWSQNSGQFSEGLQHLLDSLLALSHD